MRHDGSTEILAAAGDGLDYPSNVAITPGNHPSSLNLYAVNLALGTSFGLPPGTGPALVQIPVPRALPPELPHITRVTIIGDRLEITLGSVLSSIHARLESSRDLLHWSPRAIPMKSDGQTTAIFEAPNGGGQAQFFRIAQ